MKKIMTLISLLLGCCLPGISLLSVYASPAPYRTAPDTIWVNTALNSYVVMDEAISIVDLGTATDYGARIEHNVVFLKALKNDVSATTIFISAGNKVFAGIIQYREKNRRFLYDLREKTLNAAASFSPEHYVPEVDIHLVRDRLFSLQNEEDPFTALSVTKNKLSWTLLSLKTDPSAIYLKLRLDNPTALVYRIESISVENAEFYRKRIMSRKKVTLLPVAPMLEGNISDVKPYSSHDFYLAIPAYAVGSQGSVLVTIRESSGVRALQLEIPPRLINQADLF
jgi:hypothetical protein